MVTDTSKDAYKNHVIPKGIDKHYRREILEFMRDYPDGLTRKELGFGLGLESNQYSARCNELIKEEKLVKSGKRKCSITNKTVEVLKHHSFTKPQADFFN